MPSKITITINGETHTLAEWARIGDLEYKTIHKRYCRGIRGEKLIKPVCITKKEMHKIWGHFVWKGDKNGI